MSTGQFAGPEVDGFHTGYGERYYAATTGSPQYYAPIQQEDKRTFNTLSIALMTGIIAFFIGVIVTVIFKRNLKIERLGGGGVE